MKRRIKKGFFVKLCLLVMVLCICSGCEKSSSTQDETEEIKVETSNIGEQSEDESQSDESDDEAKTDSERFITFDPENRPDVARLLNLISLTLAKQLNHKLMLQKMKLLILLLSTSFAFTLAEC